MQPPPPFEMPGGPPRKKNSALPWLIVGGVLVCCIGPIAVLGGGGLYAFNQARPFAECQFGFSGVSGAMRKYAAAHDGKLPPAATWQSDIATYYEDSIPKQDETGPIHPPTVTGNFGCEGGKTAIVYNSAYAGKPLAGIKDPDAIIVYESPETPGSNKVGTYKDPGKAASPNMMGNKRGWFALNAMLEPVLISDGRQTPSGNISTGRRRGSN